MADIPQAALEWVSGRDTGVSSKAIWSVMVGASGDRSWILNTPGDGGDFGRCYRLLQLVPEWRPRLPEVAERFPEWAPLVREWNRLEDLYRADICDRGGRVYDAIHSMHDEIMASGGWIKTGPCGWEKRQAR